ncbi:MAG: RNA 2',3'-cyclic phosphodiesterase [bacterium]
MKIRTFIAIELGDKEKKCLGLIQNKLKRELPPVRWVKPATLHLTLKFLGYVEEDRIPKIVECMNSASRGCNPFRMRLSSIGAFPNTRNPRTIWMGIREESGALKKIAAELERLLSQIGIEPEERPFSPHLTLGRVKERGDGNVFDGVLSVFKDQEAGEVRVDRISLMRSDLTPQGPIYSELHLVELQ